MKKFLHFVLLFVGLFAVSGLFAQINTGGTPAVKFGKNTNYKFGIMPTNLPTGGTYGTSQAAADAYTTWRSTYATACGSGFRVPFGPDHTDQTVSEGIAYGMLLSVYAADKAMFDGLWATYKANLDNNGMMNWTISGCSGSVASGGATDADIDIAMALVIAAEQWSSTTGNTYTADAKAMITKIKQYELGTDGSTLNGDTWGNTNTCRNPSYFAPAYFAEFAKVDANNATFWNTTAINATNTILTANRNSTSGLVSNWCDNAGTENSCGNTGSGASGYGADACRSPWRMTVDYLWHGTAASTVAKDITTKLTAFVNGYENQLKGPFTNRSISNPSSGSYINGSYTTFALPPMTSTAAQASLNKCYTNVASLSNTDQYFNSTIRCISLFVLTGNFWAPGASGFVFPPTIASAVTDTVGTKIILTSNKALTTSTPTASTFTLYYNGTVQTGAITAVTVSGSTITLTSSVKPQPGQTITISYSGSGNIMSTEGAALAAFTQTTVLNMMAGNETILDDCDDGNSVNNVGGIWFDFNDSPDQTKACTPGTVSSIVPLSSASKPFNMTAPGYNGSAYAVNATYTLGKNYVPYNSGTSGACASWNNPAYVGIGTWCNRVQSVSMDWRTGTGVSFWYKGPECSFQVIISEVTNYGFHQVTIPAATAWTKETITWDKLTQPSWATTGTNVPVTFSAQHVQKLQWQISVGTNTPASSTGSIWIDDVRIMNMPPVPLTSMAIGIDPLSKITNPLTLTTTSTDTLKLQVVPTPTTASYPVAAWTSSDTTVVKVDFNGNIKVIGYGSATITARSKMQQNLSATYTVTVPVPPVNPTAITFTPSTYTEGIGQSTITLLPTFTPTTVNQTGVTWLSSNTAVATVNSSGVVTGVAAGTAIITATSTAVITVKGTATVTITKVPVTGITITPTPLTVVMGTPDTLTAVIAPATASVKTVTWKTSNSTIATVSGGIVTGVSPGTCNITGTSSDNTAVSQVIPVTVTSPTILPTNVAVTLTPASIPNGSTSLATAAVTPSTATDTTVTWNSSNSSIATIDATGAITAVAIGTVTITATSNGDPTISGTATLTVTSVIPTAIALSLSPASISVGSTSTSTPTFTPSNTTDKTVGYISSNTAIATVDAVTGVITAVATGTATITATSKTTSTVKGTAIITVTGIEPTIIAVTLNPTSIAIGSTSTATLAFTPTTVTDKNVTWLSSDLSVATVDANGLVTAVSAGTAIITATGKTATTVKGTATITVQPMLPSTISISLSPMAIEIGATSIATPTVMPLTTTDKTVSWSSSDLTVATVDANGIVTGVSAGTAIITATSKSLTSVKGTTTITVDPMLPSTISVSLSPTAIEIGATSTATPTVLPLTTTDKTVSWSSSDLTVATVDANGIVTGVSAGTAIITATSKSATSIKGIATITVNPMLPTAITVSLLPTSIPIGSTSAASAILVPSTTTDKTVTWSSSDQSVATVDANGIVTGVSAGTADIIATSKSATSVSGKATVTVTEILPLGIVVTPASSNTMLVNDTVRLTATISPSNATNQKVTWLSSNPAFATVSPTGLVTAIAIGGPVTITATSVSATGVQGTASVTIIKTSVTGIKVTPSPLSLILGQTATLNAAINPATATVQTVTWLSSNSAIATVSQTGVVTSVSVGTCNITATSSDNTSVSQIIPVTVTPVLPLSIAVTPKNTTDLYVGNTVNLIATILPDTTTDKSVVWSSSDKTIASVDAKTGVVTGVSIGGSVTITATSVALGTITGTASVSVVKTPVTGITVTPGTLGVVIGTPGYLNAVIDPITATIQTVDWLSSDQSVATVDANGVVTGVSAGNCTITGTSHDNSAVSQQVGVTVTSAIVLPLSLAVTPLSNTIKVTETVNLTSTILPIDASNMNVTWLSSDPTIAKVSTTGVVTGVSIGGPVTITATSVADPTVFGSATVTVVKTPVTDISITPTPLAVVTGTPQTLTVVISPTGATDKTVQWKSSDESVATVSNGVVTGIKAGKCTITGTSNDNSSVTQDVQVTVTEAIVLPTDITVSPNPNALFVGDTITLKATVNPTNVSDKSVSWLSSDNSIATVNASGVVTAVSIGGPVTISATSNTSSTIIGKSIVNVIKTPVASISVKPRTLLLEVGKTSTVIVSVLPITATIQTVQWSSSDNSIATVDAKGLITAVSSGTVSIIAKSDDNSTKTDTVTVTCVDKTALSKAITDATTLNTNATEGVSTGMYPVGSKTILQNAINAATTTNTDPTATQSQINAALVTLNAAVTSFQNSIINVNKATLAALIISSQKVNDGATEGSSDGQYPSGSKAILQTAIDAATAINTNALASQAQVDQAVTDLQKAVSDFQAKVVGINKGALATAIGTAQSLYANSTEGLGNGQYPTGSKATLQTAIDAATVVNVNTLATQPEVDTAVAKIQAAILTFQNSIITVVKSALVAEIGVANSTYANAVEGSLNGQYPVGSKAILQSAIDAASLVNTNALASQPQVDKAVKDLKTADSTFKAQVIGIDKTALANEIQSAQTVYGNSTEGSANGQYPIGSKAILQSAIDAANVVKSSSTATQAQVDQAVTDLKNAVSTFEANINILIVSNLVTAITNAQTFYTASTEGTGSGQYPVGSKAILLAAIDSANVVKANTLASQAQIDQATVDMNKALSTFQGKLIGVSKTALAAAIKSAQSTYKGASEGLTAGKYPVGSKAILNSAITVALGVNTNTAATQAEVDTAVATLNRALNSFIASVIVIDESGLLKAISAAQAIYDNAVEGVGNGQYPVGSKDVLNTAILNANNPIGDAGATQAVINQAITDLNQAVSDFKALSIIVTKTSLLSEISTAQTLYTNSVEGQADGQYPVGSKAALQTAITAANGVNTDPNVSQDAVNLAISDLQSAESSFKLLKVSVSKTILASTITSAQGTYANANEGTTEGLYPVGSKAILQSAIDAASTVNVNILATQPQVDTANAVLLRAVASFKASVIPPLVISTVIFNAERGNLTELNTPWFSYNDGKQTPPKPNGSSTVTPLTSDTVGFTMTPSGANGSANAAMIQYSLMGQAALGYPPFVGMGMGFNNPLSAYDLSGSTGVSFWVKSTNDYFLEINLTSITDDANYNIKLGKSKDWTQVTLKWSDLSQYSWTTSPQPWDLKLINQFQWKVQDADGTAGQLWIDDVRIIGVKLNLPIIADKSALVAQIKSTKSVLDAAIEGSSNGEYPVGSKALLSVVLAAADTVNANLKATQASVDKAVADLQTATAQFVAKQIHIDKTAALRALIDSAQTLNNNAVAGTNDGQYPASAKTNLQTAITSASNIASNSTVTQPQVDQAVLDLQLAISIFIGDVNTSLPVDKSALNTKIGTANSDYSSAQEGSLTGQYPVGSKAILLTAITNASAVYSNTSATQGQVNTATINLQTAITQFLDKIIIINKTGLASAISNTQDSLANALPGSKPGQYPQSSIDVLKAALTAAQTVYNSLTSTQSVVNNADTTLVNALATFAGQVVGIPSKDRLNLDISAANALLQSAVQGTRATQYPATAYATFSAAIDAAVLVSNDATVSQSDVNAADSILRYIASPTFKSAKIPSASKSNLNTKIQIALDALNTAKISGFGSLPTEYPVTDSTIFVTVLSASQLMNNDPTALQSEVDSQLTALDKAINAFKASQNPLPNKTALESAAANALTVIVKPGYSLDDVSKLFTALNSADSVISDNKATQAQVDTSVNLLNKAITDFLTSRISFVSTVSTSIKIGPNPVNDELYITSSESIHSVSIIGLTGTIVKNIKAADSFDHIDVSNLDAGYYIIKIVLGNGQISFKTVAIVK